MPPMVYKAILLEFFRFAKIASNLMSVVIFVHLLGCALIIAFNLILLEASDHIDLQVIACLYIMLSDVATNYLFCFLSERITIALIKIGDSFYESMWYRLPMQHQMLVPMIIARTQQEFHLKGLQIIPCSLNVFWRVIYKCFVVIFLHFG